MSELQLTLDREPADQYEQALVNGFPQIETLEAIWVRIVPPQLTGGFPLLRVYLALRVMDQGSRHMADRIQEAYEQRFHFEEIEFEFFHIPEDKIPSDLPSRIWRRPPRVWTPHAHRADLLKKGPR